MTTKIAFPPVSFLCDLREEVLKRSLKRTPKWKFRLSAVVMQLQPKPTYLPSASAIARGVRPQVIRFEGQAVKADGGADGAMLTRFPGWETPNWWKINFEVVGSDDTEWLLNFRGGSWRKYGAPPEGYEALKVAVLSAVRDGFFDRLTSAAMLSPRCLICGRGLTDPASMARWIGPECAGTSSLRVPLGNTETPLAAP